MAQKPLSINLLKKPSSNFGDKFIHWALSIGRLVVIATEVIALFTFAYRFTLDRQLVDLHDAIKQKLAIVKLLKPNEDTYRSLQDRIAFAAQYQKSGTQATKDFLDMLSLAPTDVVYKNILFTNNGIHIEATTGSVRSLSKFIDSIRNHPSVASVSLDQLENKPSTGVLNVGISIGLKLPNTRL